MFVIVPDGKRPGYDNVVELAILRLLDRHRRVGRFTQRPEVATLRRYAVKIPPRFGGLSYQGTLIEEISVRFEAGRIVEARAARGAEVLNKVLDTDEGARRLGEVALVPHSSPISKSGILFYNTLFDENASCHIALGQCYAKCMVGGDKLTPEQIAGQGGNKSLIHIDWMIGSNAIDIDGIRDDGSRVAVFRQDEWA